MASERFLEVHPLTAEFEGGWSDHPEDPGGKTMYGITEAVYLDWLSKKGLALRPVREITKAQALEIYFSRYWLEASCDALFPGVDRVTYDAAVNSGVGRARTWLTASVGSNDHSVTVKRICARRLSFVSGLRTWRTFGRGWARRIAAMEARGVAEALKAMVLATGPGPAERTVSRKLEVEGAKANGTAKDQGAGGAAVGTGTGAGGGSVAVSPETVDAIGAWILGGFLVVGLLLAGWLLWRAHINRQRAKAYAKEASQINYLLSVEVEPLDGETPS